MDFITNPQTFHICFSISSLLLVLVSLIINSTEDMYDSKQRRLFGMIIFDALVMNLAGLFHYIWGYSDLFQNAVSIDMNNAVVIIEKLATYLLAYLSTLYVMAIFRVEFDTPFNKALLFVPVMYSMAVFLSGFLTDYFFYFNEYGELEYRYFQGATVHICLFIYFPYVAYLYIKYARGFSTEKMLSLIAYFFLMLAGIPIRIITKSSSIFEFSVSLALLLCVYTFQNPSEY